MDISEIIMETFTLGTATGLNMTYNASFFAKSVNAAAWNRARLVEAKLSCFCSCILKCTHEINPTGKFPKRPWIREYGSLAKQVFGSVLFD